eukprot:3596052-Rhodomonas_salina.1
MPVRISPYLYLDAVCVGLHVRFCFPDLSIARLWSGDPGPSAARPSEARFASAEKSPTLAIHHPD